MATRLRQRLLSAAALTAAGALLITGCAESQRDSGGSAGGSGSNGDAAQVDGSFIFAASSDPKTLDPAFASDGESFRVSRQIFEGLVGTEPGTADPAPLLAKVASFSRTFDEDEFRVLATFLRALTKLRNWYSVRADALPAGAALAESMPPLLELGEHLEESLDERGRVLDDATPRLAELRREVRALEKQIDKTLQRLANSNVVRTALTEGGRGRVHRRGGRPCFAVKAREARKVRGLVHDRSQSGETLFVEPEEIVSSGNRLAALQADERREVGLVLTELTRHVLAVVPEFQDAVAKVAEVELAMIAVAFAADFDARWLADEEGGLQLLGARHPLLVEKERAGELEACVPIDLRLGDDFDLVVITGPNTGGKTLAMKTAGLAALMVRLGLPVLADKGSRVPLFDHIFCDIGDEQEVEQSLSTFSAHLAKVKEALGDWQTGGAASEVGSSASDAVMAGHDPARPREEPGGWVPAFGASARTLVLIDELGGGTDPDEGAALGEALLEELVRRGAPALVSTHIGRLKEVAYRLPRAENASCEFDLETLAPSYRLVIGLPGESRALAIARRLGLPTELVERAEALLAEADEGESGGSRRDALFRDLSTARRDIESIRGETEARLREVEEERDELLTAREQAAAEQKLLVREAQASLEDRLREAKQHLDASRTLLPRLSKAQATELGAALDALEETLVGATLDDTRKDFLAGLKKGDHVWVPRYRKKCPITRIFKDKQRVRVRMGRQELEIGFEEISTYDTL